MPAGRKEKYKQVSHYPNVKVLIRKDTPESYKHDKLKREAFKDFQNPNDPFNLKSSLLSNHDKVEIDKRVADEVSGISVDSEKWAMGKFRTKLIKNPTTPGEFRVKEKRK